MSGRSKTLDEIVPEGFVDQWDADSVEEALAKAEAAPTTTEEVRKCPVCGSQRVYAKTGKPQSHSVDTEFRCHNWHHFDTPTYGPPNNGPGTEEASND